MKATISKKATMIMFTVCALVLWLIGYIDWKAATLIIWTPVGLYFLLCQYIYRISQPRKTQTDKGCDVFFSQQTLERKQAVLKVLLELDKAERNHPSWPIDYIHKAAIVQEEVGELVRSANQFEYENGSITDMQKEATQTAAMGIRFLLNLKN
jgi:hypothetical protein